MRRTPGSANGDVDSSGENRAPDGAVAKNDSHVVKSIFWDRTQGRAHIPWLIAIPIIGAYVTLTIVEALLTGQVPQPVLALAVMASGALAAVLLVAASRRFLGAPRRFADYGVNLDRRWMVDLGAGLVIGALAYAIPMVVALATGAYTVDATFDAGDLPLWPGIALMVLACLCTGFWEELLLRGVFITNAMDGLGRRLSPYRAAVVAILISATVFGLPHLAQPEYPALILTWIFSGVVFGVIYVLSGNLALVIGAHATFNMAANILFVRTDLPGNAGQSAVTRVRPDPELAVLTPGGVIEASAFVLMGLLALLWLAWVRGPLRIRLRPLADPVGDRRERRPVGEPVQ